MKHSKCEKRGEIPMVCEQKLAVCPLDCPDTCSLLVDVEDGKITKINGDKNHPITKGAICNKTRHMPSLIHHPNRILAPMKRVGKKGKGKFQPITWEEAYRTIKEKFTDIIEQYGAEAILPYSFYGNMGVLNSNGMDRRFFHKLGASLLERSICSVAGGEGFKMTMGSSGGVEPEEIPESKLIIIWGCNLLSTNMHAVMPITKARKKGAKIIVIDVHENRTAKWADDFILIRPGSDAALALGIMHLLIKNNHLHHEFIENYTTGFEELKEAAKEYTPQKVTELTGITEEKLQELANLYGTISPSFIRIGNGLQHHENGGMIVRSIACLPALTGQWVHVGGGATKSNGTYGDINSFSVERPDLLPEVTPRTINMNQLGRALLQKNEPPIKALFVYSCNPAQVAPDAASVRKGLSREDLFTVVHEIQVTDTVAYADIVLPATTSFENLDLFTSYWHQYVMLNESALPPQGEAKSNFTLFKELAHVMGFAEECFLDAEEDMIRQALNNPDNPPLQEITYEQLKERKYIRLHTQKEKLWQEPPTPSGKIELFSTNMQVKGMPPVPAHIPLSDSTYPLRFIPAPNHSFLNSTYGNVEKLQKQEKQPTVYINEIDAEQRGIQTGDKVVLFNQRGSCQLFAHVGNEVLPGVAVSQGLWWKNDELNYSSVNDLTPDTLSDLGNGATFFSGTVDVRKQ